MIELLVVVAIIALLISMLLPSLNAAKEAARRTLCMAQMSGMGKAMLMYADDNEGAIPPSTHSALAVGVEPWGYTISPYMGFSKYNGETSDWKKFFNTHYRCPSDRRRNNEWSYAKNVYYELEAEETGGPTWHKVDQVRHPGTTVLFGEYKGGMMVDHFMAHYWCQGGTPEVDQQRHGHVSNYAYLDSHAVPTKFVETYDPDHQLDEWNPGTAP